jgi:uncharacterized protein
VSSRRHFMRSVLLGAVGVLAAKWSRVVAYDSARQQPAITPGTPVSPQQRFPHFKTTPVSYQRVKLLDSFWAPRQKSTRTVTVPWISGAFDASGGLAGIKAKPHDYHAGAGILNMEAIKFIEAMATVVGIERDRDIERVIDAWVTRLVNAQGSDGYLQENFGAGPEHPPQRWQTVWWSHECYAAGHYIESAIAYKEATGATTMFDSAIRVADNMAISVLDARRTFTSGHPEIEQALMRLYGVTGEVRYLNLCRWILDQRGHHEGRPSYGRMRQDDVPIRDQRTIQGHTVMAGYLFNGVTHYVAATGDPDYRAAVLAIWDDFVDHKMYVHGAGGNTSSRIEGYRKDPDCILPDDTYGESCSIFANFQWAHSLARLTGEARYIDTAERMLYNAFYASLSLRGDATFYRNVSQVDQPTPRTQEFAKSCCPPNIVKLFNKIGEFLYSVDAEGIYVNHYAASKAEIPWAEGVRLTQQTEYPWDGVVTVIVEPNRARSFVVRLRVPAWARSSEVSINGESVAHTLSNGWVSVKRRWKAGDRLTLSLPMPIERITMPPRFKEYENRVALQRGPIVYCLEEQDLELAESTEPISTATGAIVTLARLYVPESAKFEAEYRSDLLGGITVLKGEVRQLLWPEDDERALRATFVPYGVWNNRRPGTMRIWLGARKATLPELVLPEEGLGESCMG